jgi:peptidoglycan/xylan/chitin deacetylase (PgdA/CDA1 family)
MAADFEVLVLKVLTAILIFVAAPAAASVLDSPTLQLTARPTAPRVALTFDACSGKVDTRILNALVEQGVKSTVFVTGRWLKRNPAAIAIIAAHPDLFEIENHGARHLVAITAPTRVFGVRSAGSPAALAAEVEGGAFAINAAFGHKPTWFRGATALYSKASEQQIGNLGYRIAGFSRLGDGGAMYSASRTAKAFADAHDGDVIIAHINQPNRPAGAGVVAGITALKAKGFLFVTLNEAIGTGPPRQMGH